MSKKNKTEIRPDIPDTEILLEKEFIEPIKEEVTESLSEKKSEEQVIKEEKRDNTAYYQFLLIAIVLAIVIPPVGTIMSIYGIKKNEAWKDTFLLVFHIFAIIVGILSGLFTYFAFFR